MIHHMSPSALASPVGTPLATVFAAPGAVTGYAAAVVAVLWVPGTIHSSATARSGVPDEWERVKNPR
jgi:hypothetical protein